MPTVVVDGQEYFLQEMEGPKQVVTAIKNDYEHNMMIRKTCVFDFSSERVEITTQSQDPGAFNDHKHGGMNWVTIDITEHSILDFMKPDEALAYKYKDSTEGAQSYDFGIKEAQNYNFLHSEKIAKMQVESESYLQDIRPRYTNTKHTYTKRLYGTGDRVRIEHSNRSIRGRLATVVAGNNEEEYVDLCLDERRPEKLRTRVKKELTNQTGTGFEMSLPRKFLVPLSYDNSDIFYGVPEHIGVYVPKGFVHNGIAFESGSVGRVIYGSSSMYKVCWRNITDKIFETLEAGDKVYTNCYSTQRQRVQWCRIGSTSSQIMCVWGKQTSTLIKEGELFIYTGDRTLVVPGQYRNHAVSWAVSRGTILRSIQKQKSVSKLEVEIAGGAHKNVLGVPLSISPRDVKPFYKKFIKVNSEIKVVASLKFKKTDLQGLSGTVILPTDEDGDVGVQFTDNIGAGSLDGIGEEGKCLYVAAESLEVCTEKKVPS